MLYGRLDANNNIAEIISEDPTGKFPEEIVWVGIPEDFALLSTKDKNQHLKEVAAVQTAALAAEEMKLQKIVNDYKVLKTQIDIEKEKLLESNIDIDAIWDAAQDRLEAERIAREEAEAAERDAEEAAAVEEAEASAPAEEAPVEEAPAEETTSA